MKGTHVIANQVPHECTKEVEKFCKNKPDAVKTYSTNVVMIGANNVHGTVQAQMQIVTTCLIHWECTEDDWKSFQFSQQMNVQKS